MDAARSKVRKQAVEVAGRSWLSAQLLLRDIEVSVPIVDRGVDLIVFKEVGARGIRALPLQLKCASGEAFGLDQKYAERGIPLVYVWNVLTEPSAYILTYDEALIALGKATASTSWIKAGRYDKNYISAELRARLAPYRNRWDWVEGQLDLQPTSGGQ